MKTLNRIMIFGIVVILLISCSLFGPTEPILSNEDHAILSAALDSIMQTYPLETIDVYDRTNPETSASLLHFSFEHDSLDVPPFLISNYSAANDQQYELDMDYLPDYVMLKDTDESEPYSGFYFFTRPGISADGTVSVVEYSIISAPLVGSGAAMLLEKQGDDWVVIWHGMMWIS